MGKRTFFSWLLSVALLYSGVAVAKAPVVDTSADKQISRLLQSGQVAGLHYPNTVKRLYAHSDGQPIWIIPQNEEGPAWQIMMLLDCVLQYGLSPADYHPDKLTYNLMHRLLDTTGKASHTEVARTDILLSDAIITFVNHLHYGRFNPRFTPAVIDNRHFRGFLADSAIFSALPEKQAYGFWEAIEKTQPRSAAYQALQYRMRLLEGLYSGDNYEVSDCEIRLIAANMERLRWLGDESKSSTFVLINLPSFTLTYQQPDITYLFSVAIGKRDHQTPEGENKLTRIRATSAGLYFLFSSTGSPGLQGTSHKKYFLQDNRALTDGRILVDNAKVLARLILLNDGQTKTAAMISACMKQGRRKVFNIKKPIAVHLLYLTCAMKEGELFVYPDIYQKDPQLEALLFPHRDELAVRK